MGLIEILLQVFRLENLQSFSKLDNAKFATFGLTEEQYQELLANVQQVYNIIKNSTVEIVLKDDSKIKLETPTLEKCIGVSSYSQKPRIMLFNNPNNLLGDVKEVRFIANQKQ